MKAKKRIGRHRNTKGRLQKGTTTATTAAGFAAPPPVVAPTTAYTLFQCCIARARNLLTICNHMPAGQSASFTYDAYRAAIVLAISALDAYVRTFVLTTISLKIGDPNHRLSEKLKTQIQSCLQYEDLLAAARQGDLKSRIEAKFREIFEDQSFQGVGKISEAMKLIGHDNAFDLIARSAGINEENLKRDLGRFTKRRHIIAHCGDHDLSQNPPLENTIALADAESCITLVELLAKEIEKLS